MPAGGRGELRGQAGAGALGDVLGQVARALELGHDPDDGERVAELAGHRRLEEQQALDVGLDLEHQLVDGLLAGPHAGERVGSSPSSASLAAATASDTSANSRTTFVVMASSVAVVADAQLLRQFAHELAHDKATPSSSAAQALSRL